jgi:ribose transport system substrate-binding protein
LLRQEIATEEERMRRQHDRVTSGETGVTRREALGRFALAGAGTAGTSALLAACGSSSSSSSSSASSSSSGSATTSAAAKSGGGNRAKTFAEFPPYNPHLAPGPATGLPKRVATNFPADSAYFIEMEKNVKAAVTARGFDFASTTYGTDTAQNVAQIQQLMQRGIGALVAQPQDEHGEYATLLNAIKAGVCVAYEVAGPSIIQLAADQHAIGYLQGVQAVTWIKKNLGGSAQAVIFNSNEISQALAPRAQGRLDGLKTGGSGVRVVANQPIKLLTSQEGNTLAATLIQAHPGANVWLGDDDTIIGVMSALQAAGKKPSDKIYLSGVNGQANALAAVKQGSLFREDIAFPNGVYEYATGQLCCDWIEGKSVPQIMKINLIPVTSANIDQFIADDQNPAAVYDRGVAQYLTYLGNVDYRNRTTNYVANDIV